MGVQALWVGIITFIGKADYWIGTAMVGRPIVLGPLVGLALGDLSTGITIGLSLELIFMGMQPVGASIPPDMIVGSVLGTAFAITSGQGSETAIAIAFPAAVLSAFVVNVFYGIITPIMARWADTAAQEADFKKIERIHIWNGFLFDLTFAVIAGVAYYFGGETVESLLQAIPQVVMDGLQVAVGILPALGFAVLLQMIASKKVIVYFFAGFILVSYLNISTIGVVVFSLVLLAIFYSLSDFLPKKNAIESGGEDDDF